MKPSIQTLGQILYSPSQYVIPVFQRNYRWDQPQWQKLWDSLVEIQNAGKVGNHFMGFLVFVPGLAQPGQHTRFHLIDGQQRLTTCSLLLAALRNVAREKDQPDLADEVHNYFLVHPLKKGDQHFRLLPKEQDQTSFLALISNKGEPSGRMADALDYFELQVKEQAAEDPAILRRWFDVICQRLEFMCATLEAENAYSIFKSLNSTGIPLGAADLIRNFVFMHVLPDDQDEFDRDWWAPLEAHFSNEDDLLDESRISGFFRDFLMADGRYVSPKETFSAFESRYEATAFSPTELTQGLVASAGHYAVIGGERTDDSPEVTTALRALNELDSSTTYPLLLDLFQRRARGRITTAQLVQCVEMLRGFILRRFICGESSRGYGQMFVRALSREEGDPVAALRAYLLDRGWPHDSAFVEAFASFALYQRGYAKAVLTTLERARGHKEPAALEAAQIEHVMPQTLSSAWKAALGANADAVQAEWLHRPGNLTLSAYNQELGNQAFSTKKARFSDSNISLTRELAQYPAWTEAEIRSRGRALANAAAQIWIGPKEPAVAPVVTTDDEESVDRRALRLKFWTGLKDYLSDIDGAITFEPRPYRALRLTSGIRHIGLEIRYVLQPQKVAVDVYFWRAASHPVWERLRADPSVLEQLTGDPWEFDRTDGGRLTWMNTSANVPTTSEATWPDLYTWFADKLVDFQTRIAPLIREMLGDKDERIGVMANLPDTSDKTLSPIRQHHFWNELVARLANIAPHVRAQLPKAQHWLYFKLGRSGFVICVTTSSRDDRLGVELYINNPESKLRFKQLQAQRAAIENSLGEPLDWQELPDAHACRIGLFRWDSPLDDESRWNEYFDWMSERVIRLESVFRPVVRALP